METITMVLQLPILHNFILILAYLRCACVEEDPWANTYKKGFNGSDSLKKRKYVFWAQFLRCELWYWERLQATPPLQTSLVSLLQKPSYCLSVKKGFIQSNRRTAAYISSRPANSGMSGISHLFGELRNVRNVTPFRRTQECQECHTFSANSGMSGISHLFG